MAKNILITGVSSGLGHGFADTYLDRGYEVYGCSRRIPDDLVEKGLHHGSVDLTNPVAGPTVFAELISGVSSWETVYLNAGRLGKIRDMKDTPLEDLKLTMETNVWANKWILDAIFESATVDQVVAISSGASLSGSRGWNGYSLSKAALNMFVKLYAGERPETHFTSHAPGLIDSAMQDYLTALPKDDRYAPLEILKAAKGTDNMPDGRTCAEKIIEALPRIRETPSGEYTDIRRL